MNTEAYGDALDCACREIGKLQKQLASVTRQRDIAIEGLKYCAAELHPANQSRQLYAQQVLAAIKGEV